MICSDCLGTGLRNGNQIAEAIVSEEYEDPDFTFDCKTCQGVGTIFPCLADSEWISDEVDR